jgi:hypothetical protein
MKRKHNLDESLPELLSKEELPIKNDYGCYLF